jgi:transposase
MWGLNSQASVYVHVEPVDGRRGVNGLVAIVEQSLRCDAFAPSCFVFSNRARNRVRIVYWERNGFWLCTKRLEKEKFIWPRAGSTAVSLTLAQLQWLLAGVDLQALRGHETLHYRRAS